MTLGTAHAGDGQWSHDLGALYFPPNGLIELRALVIAAEAARGALIWTRRPAAVKYLVASPGGIVASLLRTRDDRYRLSLSAQLGGIMRQCSVLAADWSTLARVIEAAGDTLAGAVELGRMRRAIASLKRKGLIAPDPAWGDSTPIRWMLAPAAKKLRRKYQHDDEQQREAEEELRREWAREEAEKDRECKDEAQTLARILGMLGSAHDGERLAAAGKIEAARKRTGKTWHELLGVETRDRVRDDDD